MIPFVLRIGATPGGAGLSPPLPIKIGAETSAAGLFLPFGLRLGAGVEAAAGFPHGSGEERERRIGELIKEAFRRFNEAQLGELPPESEVRAAVEAGPAAAVELALPELTAAIQQADLGFVPIPVLRQLTAAELLLILRELQARGINIEFFLTVLVVLLLYE